MHCDIRALQEIWSMREQLYQIYRTRGHKNGKWKRDKGDVHIRYRIKL